MEIKGTQVRELAFAISNVKAGKNISKTDELKGYSVVNEAVLKLYIALNITEEQAVELIKEYYNENLDYVEEIVF